ncbi:hypothetical protein [Azonexus hydrophilus]|uniref:Uncharacterized protein n=1 Tax=Azonexus hydrophilus TaxID=418702 RepID=A0ABZ2XL86_9RHOO
MISPQSSKLLKEEVIKHLFPSMNIQQYLMERASFSEPDALADADTRLQICRQVHDLIESGKLEPAHVPWIISCCAEGADLAKLNAELAGLLFRNAMDGVWDAVTKPEVSPSSELKPDHIPDENLIKRFVLGIPTGVGPLTKELLATKGEDEWSDYIEEANIYEFEWGFIAETANHDGGASYDLFVAKAWREAEESMFADLMWPLFLLSMLDDPLPTDVPPPSAEPGEAYYTCLTFSSNGRVGPAQTRTWIGKFLMHGWPILLSRTCMCVEFKFQHDTIA